jgi:hypothetical protein
MHAGVGVDPAISALAGAQRVITGLELTNSTKATTLTTGTSLLSSFFLSSNSSTVVFAIATTHS